MMKNMKNLCVTLAAKFPKAKREASKEISPGKGEQETDLWMQSESAQASTR